MTDRETADALAREMVATGWDGWVAGMLDDQGDRTTTYLGEVVAETWIDGYMHTLSLDGRRPDLLDDATAALIAVEVCQMCPEEVSVYASDSVWIIERAMLVASAGRAEPEAWTHEHLGIAAARAWLELNHSKASHSTMADDGSWASWHSRAADASSLDDN